MVLQDLRLALNNYSLGTARTATRLTNSYVNRTTKNWLDMAKTPEEKKFVSAAKMTYTKIVQLCRKLDDFQNAYGRYNGARKELIDAKNDIIDVIDSCGMATTTEDFTKRLTKLTAIQSKAGNALLALKRKGA